MNEKIINYLKEFFELKDSIERLDGELKGLKDDKKAKVEAVEILELELRGELQKCGINSVDEAVQELAKQEMRS
ncbi:hypothetical protein [Campylobacter sputorum]|uniref:hypothetical protein n=1 Tax=Campylobacter sputorum TaxID=206 RepID=UPI00053BF9D8|nr:hypothetical protein [Campylobacter sputorum]